MDIAITGNFNPGSIKGKQFTVHKVLKPSYKLYVGDKCNDGRPITESWRYNQAVKLGCQIVRKAPQVASTASTDNTIEEKQMLVDKYSPKTMADIIGHKEHITQILTWLQGWSNGVPEKRGVLVTGPPGIGKTTSVHLIAAAAGYKVTEYNASDTRSVSVLRGLIALGVKRLVKEVIVMDEVDGLSERGGVGEIADIIRKTQTPIICIANEKPPKLRPIISACLDVKFNRPNKSTIAGAMFKVARAEEIEISKGELEELCERNGNDIRAILNALDFYGEDCNGQGDLKDSTLRLDIFSATQKLMSNKRARLDDAANLVFVDYNMVPLMVQEAYLSASKSLDEAVRASEMISVGDMIDRRIHQRQDWSLLPHFVNTTVAVARTVSGFAPFQIFPQWLGKNSKRLKHRRYLDNLSNKMFCSNDVMRMDCAEPINGIIMNGLAGGDIKGTIQQMDSMKLTRDDVMEELGAVLFEAVEIPTKTKTAFTREYNKTHSASGIVKSGKKRRAEEMSQEGEDEEDEGDEEVDELQEEMELMDI